MITATLNYLNVQKWARMDWKAVSVAGFCAIILLSFFYVWQIVTLTGGSYVFNQYEKQIVQLSEENKNLQVNFAESSFLGEVLQKAQSLNFRKIVSVKYIQIPDNSFAVAK